MRITLLFLLLLTTSLSAQKFEFGNINKVDLEKSVYSKFPDANAIVLKRKVLSIIGEYVEVHERIKILNEEGFEHATIRIPYRDVKKLKGATYNLVDNKIVKDELEKDLVFTDEEIKGYKIKKFTFPNVKAGSILEYSYKSYKNTTRDIDLQNDIPIENINVTVRNFTQGNFRIIQNPRALLTVNRVENGNNTIINAKNVPALEVENFVYDMNLFRSKISMQLAGINGFLKVGTWDDISKFMFDGDSWKKHLKPSKVYRDDLAAAIGGETDEMKKAKIIYDFIKANIKWNEYIGYVPDHGIRDAYKKKEGDVGDLNMMYISMLRSVGIDADPVLASTKGHGVPVVANYDAFNYLLVAVHIGGKTYVKDVAHTKSTFDMIPEYTLNWQGMLIREDQPVEWVDLTKTAFSSDTMMVSFEIDEDLIVTGDVNQRLTGYNAMNLKSRLKDIGDKQKEELIDFDYKDMDLSELSISTDSLKAQASIKYSFEMEDAIDEVGEKLYVSPLFFLAMTENTFNKEERKYPIDFGFPEKNNFIVSLNVPEGYVVESLPESIRMMMPEGAGSYAYRINQQGDKIQINCQYQIKQFLFPYDSYLDLKSFFQKRLEKEAEKIVLTKA